MEIFGNFQKTSETVQKSIFRSFYDCLEFSENLRKSSEIFGKLRKRFKSNFQMFLMVFLKFSDNLRKCLEIFGKFPDVIENVRNGSQELTSFEACF